MRLKTLFILFLMAVLGTGCVNDALDVSKLEHKEVRLSAKTRNKIAALGMDRYAPIMVRIFKEEGVLEVWKQKRDGRYAMVKDYQVCAWSGMLGPKKREGDRQAPEGFYDINRSQMNPNSSYYLAFNIGYPNAYDRSWGRTGANLMVHGACSSRGCYSMTDLQIQEIFALAEDAFKGGQTSFQVQALPFRMTADNMARHSASPNYEFWQMLKVGYDHFELTKTPPTVAVCERKYVFNQISANGRLSPSGQCPAMSTPPALAQAYASQQLTYEKALAKAQKKYEGLIWAEPTEAQRKAVVADLRKKYKEDAAFAPTGNGLDAGKLVRIETLKAQEERAAAAEEARAAAQKAETEARRAAATTAAVPVPEENPVAEAKTPKKKKPFWKLFSSDDESDG